MNIYLLVIPHTHIQFFRLTGGAEECEHHFIFYFTKWNSEDVEYFLIRQGAAVHMRGPIYRQISDAAVVVSDSFSV